MVSESKPLPEEMLKETYVLAIEAGALYYAVKFLMRHDGQPPEQLVEMLEQRLTDVESNLADIVNPHPF